MATAKKSTGVANGNSPETTQATMNLTQQVQAATHRQRELAEVYKSEDKETIHTSPFYKPYFGNNMCISINGIPIYIPLDGKVYTIPKTYAGLYYERIQRVDNQIERNGIMSGNIEESTAGEIQLLGEL